MFYIIVNTIYIFLQYIAIIIITTWIPQMLGRFFFYKMKTKIFSNHMSQYFILNRTENITNV